MVTDESSEKAEDGRSNRPSSFRYGDKFEEMCGYYLSLGMSYEDYWDGDNCMTKYYRRKGECDKERVNFYLWLQGAYIYEALLDSSPVINALSGKKKPNPYLNNPIPITVAENKQAVERANANKLKNGKDAMRAMVAQFNKSFQNKGKDGEITNGD